MDIMNCFTDYITDDNITVLDVLKDFSHCNGFNVPIKGGLALNYLYNDKQPSSRNTVDIDYHFREESEWNAFKKCAVENANKDSKLGINYSIIKEKVNNNGSSLTLEFTSDKLNGTFRIDMNYGSYCKTIDLGNVVVYAPEMIIADKLSVICSTNIQRRCKDLYDIYLIISHENFQLKELVKEINRKLDSRNIKLGKLSLLNPSILVNLMQGYRKVKLYDMPNFAEVCRLDFKFILPILSSIDKSCDDIIWDCKNRNWNTGKIYGSVIGRDLNGIIVRETASGMLGLSTFPPYPVIVSNDKIDLDLGFVKFISKDYNTNNIISVGDNLYISTKERTIVDMLDDGEYRILLESLENYLDSNESLKELYQVAEQYDKLDVLKQAIKESLETNI